tara:strand:- start:1466 stop:2824 length:1359 start_codon:yes stop_codon:yes gene_type:complete
LTKLKPLSLQFSQFKEIANQFSDRNAIVYDLDPIYKENSLDDELLHGRSILIKDNIAVKGWPLSCSSKILQDYISPYNSTVVNKILESGGVIVGKTNHDEFAMGSSNEYSVFGPAKHPTKIDRVPGGSSGGSATAIKLKMADFALGSDTGGSVRQPAAFCGVYGMKPTYGRVSRYGLVAFASSFDQIGPFARTTEGIARLLQVISGKDPKDATSAENQVPDYLSKLGGPIAKRIGVPWSFLKDGVDVQIINRLKEIELFLKSNGCEICEVSLPHAKHAIAAYYVLTNAEASSNLARYDGVRYGLSKRTTDLESMYKDSRSKGFGNEVKRRIMLGTYVLSSGYYDAYFKKAQQVRRLIQNDFIKVFKDVDLILLPTTPTPAFKQGEHLKNPLEMYLSDIFTTPISLAGVPTLNIPAGETSDNLPIGMQLVGNFFKEETILCLSHYIEDNLNLV